MDVVWHGPSKPSWLLRPANGPLDAPAPGAVAAMRGARERNAVRTAAELPLPSPRRFGEPLAEPTPDVCTARERCAQLAMDGAARRSAAARTDPAEPALTPAVAGAKARVEKLRAYADPEAVSARRLLDVAAYDLSTARVSSVRKALPAPAWSWVPLPAGPKQAECEEPSRLVELSMVRMGDGALRSGGLSRSGPDARERPSLAAVGCAVIPVGLFRGPIATRPQPRVPGAVAEAVVGPSSSPQHRAAAPRYAMLFSLSCLQSHCYLPGTHWYSGGSYPTPAVPRPPPSR